MVRKLTLVIAGTATLAVLLPVLAQSGGKEDSPDVAAIKSVFKQHRKAFNEHKIDEVLKFYAPDAVVMGTGPGELYIGHENIAEAYRHFCADFKPGSQKTKITWQRAKIKGDAAWLLINLEESQQREGEDTKFHMNISIVFEKINGKWMFSTLHFSNLTGGE